MLIKANAIKICFIAPKAYPIFNPEIKEVFGGSEVDLYLLACQLAKDENFNVSFITADYGQPEIETIENVTIIKSLNFKKNPLAGVVNIWKSLRKADAEFYMIKTFSMGMFLSALFCKLNNKKFIYRTANQRESNGKYIKEHFILGKLFNWSLRNCTQIIVQNQVDKENLERVTGITPVTIPNAHYISPLIQTAKQNILWVGRSDKIKKPELFLNLAKQYPNQKFVMICQKATIDKNYQALIEHAKTINNLEFLNRVEFGIIDSYFQDAKLLVNTSDSEGFPNTFIQACKAATPILSLNVNPDNFLESFNCGICANGNWNKFSEAFLTILRQDNFVKYCKNARQYVEQKHDITKVIDRYKELFKTLSQRRSVND